MYKKFLAGTAAIATSTLLLAAPASAALVDLSGWLVDGGGNWVLQSQDAPNDSVLQTLNSAPTMFFNNTNSQGLALSGSIEVQTTSDDDFIGFVLGYDDGDLTGSNPTTDYILVDWKQGTQSGWDAGMSISRVTGSIDTCGTCTGTPPWDHNGTVSFIERAATLGDVGWADNTEYLFDIIFTSTFIEVKVDDVVQFSLNGTFEDGSFGFYNFSQQTVLYAGITEDVAPEPTPTIPEPASIGLFGIGLAGFSALARRRRKQTDTD